MLAIKNKDARICLGCGDIHDVTLKYICGKDFCPQCGEEMSVTMQTYIDAFDPGRERDSKSDFNFLLTVLMMLAAFAAGIICGGQIVQETLR